MGEDGNMILMEKEDSVQFFFLGGGSKVFIGGRAGYSVVRWRGRIQLKWGGGGGRGKGPYKKSFF